MNYFLAILSVVVLSLTACGGSQTNAQAEDRIVSTDPAINLPVQSVQYKVGDLVPTAQVCMVNDAFMGKNNCWSDTRERIIMAAVKCVKSVYPKKLRYV